MSVRGEVVRIGLSARLMHCSPRELGFHGKTLQYLEQSIAHWMMARGALVVMLPTLGFDAEVARRSVSVSDYVQALDGLVLQGGADVSPRSYGQEPLRPAWTGDGVRDRYEMELLEGFVTQGKPVLGICRGAQLINVAFGGSLLQDIELMRPGALRHADDALYDRLHHSIDFEANSRLTALYGGALGGKVNSIHHQAVDRLGGDLRAEAWSREDRVVEAIGGTGSSYVLGVQWHPEFHSGHADLLGGDPLLDDFFAAALQARRW